MLKKMPHLLGCFATPNESGVSARQDDMIALAAQVCIGLLNQMVDSGRDDAELGHGWHWQGANEAFFAIGIDLSRFEADPSVQNLGKQLTVQDMCNFVEHKLAA